MARPKKNQSEPQEQTTTINLDYKKIEIGISKKLSISEIAKEFNMTQLQLLNILRNDKQAKNAYDLGMNLRKLHKM